MKNISTLSGIERIVREEIPILKKRQRKALSIFATIFDRDSGETNPKYIRIAQTIHDCVSHTGEKVRNYRLTYENLIERIKRLRPETVDLYLDNTYLLQKIEPTKKMGELYKHLVDRVKSMMNEEEERIREIGERLATKYRLIDHKGKWREYGHWFS